MHITGPTIDCFLQQLLCQLAIMHQLHKVFISILGAKQL